MLNAITHWCCNYNSGLTHWSRVTHICVSKLTIIGSDNGLSPGRRQAIIWPSAGILFIGSLRTNFSEILIGIQTFAFKKMLLKMSSAKWRPFCLALNVLNQALLKSGRGYKNWHQLEISPWLYSQDVGEATITGIGVSTSILYLNDKN